MKKITVETKVKGSIDKIWEFWTKAEHIVNWNFAIPEWHCPQAENNLEVGKSFRFRMEARDGSMGFDYEGTYTQIEPKTTIEYALGDERKVSIDFKKMGNAVSIVETFEVEDTNTLEQQQQGWQAILDNFKSYVESN
ncbi:SRPBCC family protein [Flagellimonas meridianipacifica]|uniref:Uncharacterized protein YndB with AHSA1/START domain n=1 Tax=Flagellimonas meridianipacifica TaxID=1080225 RepID=A0A2T0M9U7_9FLAO|nr:SRPBCC family protein [Allomuricauda pacifica]PRX54250.1 uncharacterized protein YndB with AHSA1/START domain [Allomuricauda pacifica]